MWVIVTYFKRLSALNRYLESCLFQKSSSPLADKLQQFREFFDLVLIDYDQKGCIAEYLDELNDLWQAVMDNR